MRAGAHELVFSVVGIACQTFEVVEGYHCSSVRECATQGCFVWQAAFFVERLLVQSMTNGWVLLPKMSCITSEFLLDTLQ